MDAAFQALDFPGLDWGGYSREEVLDLLTEAALDSLDGTGADFADDQPATPPDPSAFFALAERDGAAAALAAWEEARFYSPDQLRDDRGRWSSGGGGGDESDPFRGGMAHAGRAELRTASAAHVRDFVAKGGPASGEEVAALGDHLARLTVAQLHDLRREHGLPAAGAWRMRRPDLVNALAGRFRDHRAGTPTRAARELAAAAAGGTFNASKYTPGDSTHAVEHGRTGFTVSAHPDGRFHVWDTGLAHQGAHDTAAAAVAHAAAPPAKSSPDYQPRTADVETAARQGAVADAAARRGGATQGGDPARYQHALEKLAPDPDSLMRRNATTQKVAEIFARTTDKVEALRQVRQLRSYQSGNKETKEALRSYVDQLYASVAPTLPPPVPRSPAAFSTAAEPPAERPVRFVPLVQPAEAARA